MTRRLRVLAIGDTDSYVKWGAALVDRAPAEWDREMLVLRSALQPSDAQLEAALAGTRFASDGERPARRAAIAEFADAVRDSRPDVLLLTVRGPVVKVLMRAALDAVPEGAPRPVVVGGLPGISIPATRKAIGYRAQTDLIVVHSRRETREFADLGRRIGLPRRYGLATLPFLAEAGSIAPARRDGDIVFAAQAKVPETREQRIALLGWLAEAARRTPWRRVVVKVRGRRGEAQTHPEEHDYADLLAALSPAPPRNLVVADGPMASHLEGAAGLVTVSSTAAIEALAAGVPVIALDDFGVRPGLINTVFVGSGLLAGSGELVTGRFRDPDPAWLEDNYFHGREADDWTGQVEELVALRDAGALPIPPQTFGVAGGRLRHAWDRRRALGAEDRSALGVVALAIGHPARVAYRLLRRLRGRVRALSGRRQDALADAPSRGEVRPVVIPPHDVARAVRRHAADATPRGEVAGAKAGQSAGEGGSEPRSASASQNASGTADAAAASPGSSATRSVV